MIVSISSPPKKMMSIVISGYDVQFLKGLSIREMCPAYKFLNEEKYT
jgi:hypothetical protein